MYGDYKVTFESELPLVVEEVKPEGAGLKSYDVPVLFSCVNRK